MRKSKQLPPASKTKPETFILESLDQEDELQTRLDGRILYEVLKLQGKKPLYYYFRTQREIIEFAKIFSGKRGQVQLIKTRLYPRCAMCSGAPSMWIRGRRAMEVVQQKLNLALFPAF